ncbi:MAG: hypothetical protein ACRBN8_28920 [Nannocystales bacterium]
MKIFSLTARVRYWGPTDDSRPSLPFTATERVLYEAVFAEGACGAAGALHVGEDVVLAVNERGAGWRVVDGRMEPLRFGEVPPKHLATGTDASSPTSAELRAQLAALRWCVVRPTAPARFLLVSGLELDLSGLDASRADLLDALPTPASPGFFGRLRGAKPPEGVALLLSVCPETENPPDGWLPWLRFYRGLGLEFHCWGTEGGGEMEFHDAPAPDGPIEDALLEVLRTHDALEQGQFTELYLNWLESGESPESGFRELVPGQPERGHWCPAPLDEVAKTFEARVARRDVQEGQHVRVRPGTLLVAHLRKAIVEPVALALHAEPTDESVVVWFIVGGISKTSGRLEVFLSERVWS